MRRDQPFRLEAAGWVLESGAVRVEVQERRVVGEAWVAQGSVQAASVSAVQKVRVEHLVGNFGQGITPLDRVSS